MLVFENEEKARMLKIYRPSSNDKKVIVETLGKANFKVDIEDNNDGWFLIKEKEKKLILKSYMAF